ncbi:hypothetical protein [Citromicrobium bathyomarinum]|uniref:DUF3108 domain-containing protein n=1 Tax=Citromicrobium bathyomarinum TaxID=72174 RepID=UPI00315B1514
MRLLLASLVFLAVPAVAQDATTTAWSSAIDGDRLKEGQTCFALKAGEDVVGFQRETITPDVSIEGPAWRIVSQQVLPERGITFVDHFLLDRETLAPIAFHSILNGQEIARLSYLNGRIFGKRFDRQDKSAKPVDLTPEGPVLDGNLWGPLLAALDLEEGMQLRPQIYQYNDGLGRFVIDVTGVDTIETVDGPREVYLVDMGFSEDRLTTYLIGTADGTEYGTRADGFSTTRLPSCAGVDAAG